MNCGLIVPNPLKRVARADMLQPTSTRQPASAHECPRVLANARERPRMNCGLIVPNPLKRVADATRRRMYSTPIHV